MTVVNDRNKTIGAIDAVFSNTRRIILEEFVEKDGYQITGDGFLVNGELKFKCFANEYFDTNGYNSVRPSGERFPYFEDTDIHNKVHDEVQRLLKLLKHENWGLQF